MRAPWISFCIIRHKKWSTSMNKHALIPQGAYAGFVYTYGTQPPLSLPHKMAGYLPSIFWAAITAGRLLSIPLSYRFQPVRLLMFNIVRPMQHTEYHHMLDHFASPSLILRLFLFFYRQVPSLLCWCCLFSTPVRHFCLLGRVYVGFS